MIFTPYGCHVKHVSHLDENRGLATVIGYKGQVMQYAINVLGCKGGIEEIRQNHEEYKRQNSPLQLDTETGMIVSKTG
ncbi:MAG: hypothetical protein WCH39_01605 [Schlesneria sp.]